MHKYQKKKPLSEHEVEQIQGFLEAVHQKLKIPLVLQECTPDYPIVLAENHSGMSVQDQENLINFIQKKYQLDKNKVILKTLITSRHNLVHIGLSRGLVQQLSTSSLN